MSERIDKAAVDEVIGLHGVDRIADGMERRDPRDPPNGVQGPVGAAAFPGGFELACLVETPDRISFQHRIARTAAVAVCQEWMRLRRLLAISAGGRPD